ncbi:MAG: glycosyltransferase family 2 protein [Rikenellaceae bacterium]|jgi:glycosyltransferase involved in cell wall biosynthesis|nr:glycosyltransferase family 2 protein [Rikenellaceae bacterium]
MTWYDKYTSIYYNSTDNTADVIKGLGMKYMLQAKPGHGNARQYGLEHARGKYYLTVDTDTIYPHGYLQKMIGELEKAGRSHEWSEEISATSLCI